jgi:hypothetical protein
MPVIAHIAPIAGEARYVAEQRISHATCLLLASGSTGASGSAVTMGSISRTSRCAARRRRGAVVAGCRHGRITAHASKGAGRDARPCSTRQRGMDGGPARRAGEREADASIERPLPADHVRGGWLTGQPQGVGEGRTPGDTLKAAGRAHAIGMIFRRASSFARGRRRR